MMASNTTVRLLQIILLLATCLIHYAACFSLHRTSLFTSQHCRNNPNNLHTSSHHHQPLNCHFTTTAIALSVSSHETTKNDQWKYHVSYTASRDEIIHGRYNAVITKTTDLTNRWIGSFDPSSPLDTTTLQTIHTNNNNNAVSPPIEALKAIQATHRWADKFVRQLNLCPWAGSSLDKEGAICYWALLIDEHDDEGVVLSKMEEIVREAGVQLTLATSDEEGDGGRIDPSVAISFIVLVPMKRRTNNSSNNNDDALPDFGSFHEFFIDLEDRLLDECDDYWDEVDAADNNNEEDEETNDNAVLANVNSLGCEITIAAFHPKWQFNGSNEQTDGDAIDYEKRTPYPTISIVMSSVIESLMKEREEGGGSSDEDSGTSSALATERIADLNEKTLCAIGRERLKEIFDEEVLGCPMNTRADDASDE